MQANSNFASDYSTRNKHPPGFNVFNSKSTQGDYDDCRNLDQEFYGTNSSGSTPYRGEINPFNFGVYDQHSEQCSSQKDEQTHYFQESFSRDGSSVPQPSALNPFFTSLSCLSNPFPKLQQISQTNNFDLHSQFISQEFSQNQQASDKSTTYHSKDLRSYEKGPEPSLNTSSNPFDEKLEIEQSDSKNIPKTFGNYLKYYLKDLSKKQQLSEYAMEFINVKGQHNYTLEQFKTLFQCKKSKPYLLEFFESKLYVCLIQSKRKENPQRDIPYIDQYILGIQHPDKFISNVKKCKRALLKKAKGQCRKKPRTE